MGPEGYYRLRSGDNFLILANRGTKVAQFKMGRSVILPTVIRSDDKEAMTHPCTPLFGPELPNTSYGIDQHSNLRNTYCTPEELQRDFARFRYVINDGSYPTPVIVERRFKVNPAGLVIETIHDNQSGVEVPTNLAEHAYFHAPKGIEGAKLNGEFIAQVAQEDRVLRWDKRNILEIPGLPRLVLSQLGLDYVNIWVYVNKQRVPDSHYIAVEPVEGDSTPQENPDLNYFGSEMSMLVHGKKRYARFAISRADTCLRRK